MAHNEVRTSAWKEAQIALFTGSIYGATHTLTGHPLDTIKSKMQIQQGFTNLGAMKTAAMIFKNEGIIGFFKGCVPPLWGSMVYRGVMMSTFEYCYTWFEHNYEKDHFFRQELGLGVRPIIPISGFCAAFVRGFVESPIEYAKVMGQTSQKWRLNQVYRGFPFQVVRTTFLVTPIFTMVDAFRQKTSFLKSLLGNFCVVSFCSGAAYMIMWPLETMKNLAQSGTPSPGATVKQRLEFIGGPKGLFRGIWPGTLSGAMRNGFGMVAMVYAQQWATKLGMRDV